jgi:hypothetical protein
MCSLSCQVHVPLWEYADRRTHEANCRLRKRRGVKDAVTKEVSGGGRIHFTFRYQLAGRDDCHAYDALWQAVVAPRLLLAR